MARKWRTRLRRLLALAHFGSRRVSRYVPLAANTYRHNVLRYKQTRNMWKQGLASTEKGTGEHQGTTGSCRYEFLLTSQGSCLHLGEGKWLEISKSRAPVRRKLVCGGAGMRWVNLSRSSLGLQLVSAHISGEATQPRPKYWGCDHHDQ